MPYSRAIAWARLVSIVSASPLFYKAVPESSFWEEGIYANMLP